MLKLSRKKGQKLLIVTDTGKVVELVIDSVGTKKVEILISAPKEVTIHRGEKLEKAKNVSRE